MTDPRLSWAEAPLCFAVASDAIVVCSTQFVTIAQLCGAPAGVGITMVIALGALRAGERGRAGRSRLGGEAMVPRGGIPL